LDCCSIPVCRTEEWKLDPVKNDNNALNSGAKLLWLTLKTALHLHGKNTVEGQKI
jgi:hypothetical protein